MEDYDKLMVGDQSTDGRIIIADKDRLCYLVKSGSKGSLVFVPYPSNCWENL